MEVVDKGEAESLGNGEFHVSAGVQHKLDGLLRMWEEENSRWVFGVEDRRTP